MLKLKVAAELVFVRGRRKKRTGWRFCPPTLTAWKQISKAMFTKQENINSTSIKAKVIVFSFDAAGTACAAIRILHPLSFLKDQLEVFWCVGIKNKVAKVNDELIETADLIIIQRGFPCKLTLPIINKCLDSGKPVIYDIDDNLLEIPSVNPIGRIDQNKAYLIKMIEKCHSVTVSTDELKKKILGINPHVHVLPNLLNDNIWKFNQKRYEKKGQLTIGYAGTITHENDLGQIELAIEKIGNEYGTQVNFLFFGCVTDFLKKECNVHCIQFESNYTKYAQKLQQLDLDIMVVPLEDNEFNRCKSNIKWLEVSSCGIPGIYSDLPPYNSCVKHLRNGMLAGNNYLEWFDAMVYLIENPEMRKMIGQTAQMDVMHGYRMSDHADIFLNTYQKIGLSFLGLNNDHFKSIERESEAHYLSFQRKTHEKVVSNSIKEGRRTAPSSFVRTSIIQQSQASQHTKEAPTYSFVVYGNGNENLQRLQKSVEDSFLDQIQILNISDAKSCAEAYNRGVLESTGDIIIFCRNDVEILSIDLNSILAEDLSTFDIVGAVGTSRIISGHWISAGQPYIHGQIAHRGRRPTDPIGLHIYGLGRDSAVVQNIQALSGVFVAVKRHVFSKINFDEGLPDDMELACLDLTFRAYLLQFRLAVDHRIMLTADAEQPDKEFHISCARRFSEKHSSDIQGLNAQSDTTYLHSGERAACFIKQTMTSTRETARNLMHHYGSGGRVNLKAENKAFDGFDNICIHSMNADTGLPYQDNSVNYLRIEDARFLSDHKFPWMREFYRVCAQGSILEINMHWQRAMGEEREKLWKYHDFYCFDLNRPGYYKVAQEKGFDGAFAMQSISSHANGTSRRLTAYYQVIKNKQNIEWLQEKNQAPPRESVIARRATGRTPRFSIIIPHYQGTINHSQFLKGIASLLRQTIQDFEILCYHDGPLLNPVLNFPVRIFPTAKRYNDWGHSLRDIGIHEARGEYIVHFNPDNILYPNALECLNAGCKDILVFPVIMNGMERDGDLVFQQKHRDARTQMVLTGNPVVYGGIDCMQFVMKRDRWLEHGGWFDKRGNSDGFLYPMFAEMHEVEFIGDAPLGEHW
jgi:glycosyltransferase involved in cell wall biosynthesis